VRRIGLLLLAFALSVWLRTLVGTVQSLVAGLVFAALLLALSLAARTRVPVSRRAVLLGLAGVVLVCLPATLEHLVDGRAPNRSAGFVTWALAVTVVATAEEVFLRGTLYDAVQARLGEVSAIVVGAVCFALLHVPLYGWYVLPLDLAVGVVLGGLRQQSGTPAAPAVTHVGADLVGWFVR
jgi:membrane protease YdiL (CAAX protease family)